MSRHQIAQRRREITQHWEDQRRAEHMLVDQCIDAEIEHELKMWILDQEEFEDKPVENWVIG